MIAGLERCTYPPMAVLATVVVALTAAILALLPGAAEAQEGGQGATVPATPPAHSSTVVVAPGDTLWSISQERLGPDAAPRQIALDVQRIHQTNLNLMGADPNLLFAGQRLALPPPPPGAGAPAADGPEAASPEARTAPVAARGAPAEQAPAEQEVAARPATERATEPIALPALPEGEAVPEARSLPSRAAPGWGLGGLPEEGPSARRLLGLGIITLTLLLAGLMAWRLPMRRAVGGDAEAWGLHPSYYHHYRGGNRHRHHDDHQEGTDLLVEGRHRPVPVPTNDVVPANGHEPGRSNGAAGGESPLKKGLAVAHSPWVRRTLRRPSRGAPTPGRPPRNGTDGATGQARRAARSAAMRRRSTRRRPRPAGLARGRSR